MYKLNISYSPTLRTFLLVIILSQIIPQKGFSQIYEKDLIGTWIPTSVEDQDWHSVFSNFENLLLNLSSDDLGKFEYAGNNDQIISFKYEILEDSIVIRIDNDDESRISFRPSHINSESFLANYSDGSSVLYAKLYSSNGEIDSRIFREFIVDNSWIISPTSKPRQQDFEIFFDPVLRDSSQIRSEDFPSLRFAEAYPKLYKDDNSFWSVGEHNGVTMIKLYQIFSNWFNFATVDRVGKNLFHFHTWYHGEKINFIATKRPTVTPKQSQELFQKLVHTKWQLSSEVVPSAEDTSGEFMDLGMIEDDFEEVNYKHDSTSLINQDDLDQKLLILEFKPDSIYNIYRQDRLLDRGIWSPKFRMRHIDLESFNDHSKGDGIFGGTIKIESLRKNKLRIKREFDHQLNSVITTYSSNWEIYKPYRKQKRPN